MLSTLRIGPGPNTSAMIIVRTRSTSGALLSSISTKSHLSSGSSCNELGIRFFSDTPYWRRGGGNGGVLGGSSDGGSREGSPNPSDPFGASTLSSSKSVARIGEPPEPTSIVSLALSPKPKPLFPGMRNLYLIKDPRIMNHIEGLIKRQTPYVGLFYRTDYPESELDKKSGGNGSEPGPISEGSGLVDRFGQPLSSTSGGVATNSANATSSSSDSTWDEEIVTHPSQLYEVGVLASIQGRSRTGNFHGSGAAGMQISVTAHRRISLKHIQDFGPPLLTTVEHWTKNAEYDTESEDDSMCRALVQETLRILQEIFKLSPYFREFLEFAMQSPMFRTDYTNPHRLADLAAHMVGHHNTEEIMAILQERSGYKRLQLVYALLRKELEVLEAQAKIRSSVEEKMQSQQREYYLREQMKVIKRELGMEKDDKESLLQKYKERIAEKKGISEEILEVINSEMDKLSSLDKNSSEYNVSRNYLDWLTVLPYEKYSKDNYNLLKAKEILDRDHYGLNDVKERILEFIGVGKLKGTVQGKIICMVGPPGTGKTSIGKSIAESLNREFYRFSVGGLSDVAEIKGHRRTYIGSMPGKLIQCLKQTKVSNPLILIDEIDKLGRGHQGDPSSALLEVLDPSQNQGFVDHFLDVPIDLSQVLFICTANVLDTIPGPLLDRMEVVRLSGYDHPEKVQISKKYLIPKVMEQTGLASKDEAGNLVATIDDPSFISEDAVDSIIRWYCREAGVRNLQKQIEKLCRKRAFQRAELRDKKEKAEEERKRLEKEKVEITNSEETGEILIKPNESEVNKAKMNEMEDFKDSTSDLANTTTSASSDASTTPTDATTAADASSSSEIKEADPDPLKQITQDNLHDYLGKPLFTSDKLFDIPPAGVVMGLAWTAMGGSTLYIETKAIENSAGTGQLNVTGQLGNVMQESSKISMVVAKKFHPKVIDFAKNNDIYLHVPEGATPKDGPSAGVTMTTALISLALDKPLLPDVAMTGEVSLTGMVLPVGGIKEKTIAARRSACKTLLYPEGNRRDVAELPEYLKENIEIHFCKKYEDVWRKAFGEEDLPKIEDITLAEKIVPEESTTEKDSNNDNKDHEKIETKPDQKLCYGQQQPTH